jgi:hypothetical protein
VCWGVYCRLEQKNIAGVGGKGGMTKGGFRKRIKETGTIRRKEKTRGIRSTRMALTDVLSSGCVVR